MFPKRSIFVLAAMFAAILLSPSVSADHDTPADRCSGLYETNGCEYCSRNGDTEDYSDFYCNNHHSGYSWQECQTYIAGHCIQGAFLRSQA